VSRFRESIEKPDAMSGKTPAAEFAGYFGRNWQEIVGKDFPCIGTMFEEKQKQFVHVH